MFIVLLLQGMPGDSGMPGRNGTPGEIGPPGKMVIVECHHCM